MLAGNSGVEGKYELGIDSISLVNEEDIHAPSGKLLANVMFIYSLCYRKKR